MNAFIILSILIIVIGALLIVATPSVLFKFNWNEKSGLEKILMFIFYSVLVYIINIIYWIIKWVVQDTLDFHCEDNWLNKNYGVGLEWND